MVVLTLSWYDPAFPQSIHDIVTITTIFTQGCLDILMIWQLSPEVVMKCPDYTINALLHFRLSQPCNKHTRLYQPLFRGYQFCPDIYMCTNTLANLENYHMHNICLIGLATWAKYNVIVSVATL